MPALNSLTLRPRLRIKPGSFAPPNSNTKTPAIIAISGRPGQPIPKICDVPIWFKLNIFVTRLNEIPQRESKTSIPAAIFKPNLSSRVPRKLPRRRKDFSLCVEILSTEAILDNRDSVKRPNEYRKNSLSTGIFAQTLLIGRSSQFWQRFQSASVLRNCSHAFEPFALASGINRMPLDLAIAGPNLTKRPTLARSAHKAHPLPYSCKFQHSPKINQPQSFQKPFFRLRQPPQVQ